MLKELLKEFQNRLYCFFFLWLSKLMKSHNLQLKPIKDKVHKDNEKPHHKQQNQDKG